MCGSSGVVESLADVAVSAEAAGSEAKNGRIIHIFLKQA